MEICTSDIRLRSIAYNFINICLRTQLTIDIRKANGLFIKTNLINKFTTVVQYSMLNYSITAMFLSLGESFFLL